ncbi:MAG: methyltransferase domain-containing protein [Candidatus Latescibacteria bacterium]|nr:methyltransferase domain-containing protein [Candidatus Latescibacterota bacterium]
MDSAKLREKEFHDKYYSEGGRENAGKFNAIRISSNEYYTRTLMELCPGKKLLEIGCSEGGISSRLASLGAEVTGIDISEVAVKNARMRVREKNLTGIEYQVMDAENLEFEEGTFDIIYGGSILHHLDIEKIYKEIARTLKPDGIAIFSEPLGHNPFINIYRKLTPRMRTADEHPLLMNDITIANKFFKLVDVKYFYLFSICAAPFHKNIMFKFILGSLEMLDRSAFMLLPFIKKYAWTAIIKFSNPL